MMSPVVLASRSVGFWLDNSLLFSVMCGYKCSMEFKELSSLTTRKFCCSTSCYQLSPCHCFGFLVFPFNHPFYLRLFDYTHWWCRMWTLEKRDLQCFKASLWAALRKWHSTFFSTSVACVAVRSTSQLCWIEWKMNFLYFSSLSFSPWFNDARVRHKTFIEKKRNRL